MSNPKTLFQFLTKHRIRLNLILTATKFITWFTWTGVGSGLILLVACRFSRFSVGIGIWLWLSLALFGGLLGLFIGWRQRLDNYAAAGWLDEHFNNGELLSAAVVCLNRDCSGCFDKLIFESAAGFILQSNRIKWPVRQLVKQTGIAVIVTILFTSGWLYQSPLWRNSHGSQLNTAEVQETIEKMVRQNDRQLVVDSPRTLAKMLFPEDERMAMLAERAFREGNLAVLQNLLRDSELNMERLMASAANPEELDQLKNEVEQKRQLLETLVSKSQQHNQSDSPGQVGEELRSPQPDSDQKGNEQTTKDNRLAQGYNPDQGDRKEMTDTAQNQTGGIPAGGNKAGTGHHPNPGKWGEITARTGRDETIISKNKESQLLEYVLPGKDARIPLSQIVPDAERTAEAAIHRQGIPFEYEDFIRNYFLSLAQESKEAAKKEAQE